jgi:nicotinamidase-related amidase
VNAELNDRLDPSTTVVIFQECQNGVIGESAALPDLAAACTFSVIPRGAAIASAARRCGVPVIHTTAQRRPDGWGSNTNARLFAAMSRSPVQLTPGSKAVEPIKALFHDDDIVLSRLHGLSPFEGTELDSLLRNAGIRTIVACGVSVNIAITNLTFDAVNAGYQVVIPADAVAGVPIDYAEAVLEHTLSLVATVTTAESIVDAWL